MVRRLLANPGLLGALLLWLVTGAFALAVALSWPGAVVFSVVALLVAASSYLLLVVAARVREEADQRLNDAARDAWNAGAPGVDPPGGTDAETVLLRTLAGAAERTRATLEAQEARARSVEAILDGIDGAVVTTDERAVVFSASRLAASLLQRTRTELIGTSVEELFTQEEILTLHREAAEGRAGRIRVRMPRIGPGAPTTAGPARVVEVAASPLGLDGAPRRGVVLTLHDVTEFAHAAQLKTDFVANASHELRTPLAAIRAAAETLTEHDDPEIRAKLLRMIAGNVGRLEDLTRDLLDLSRLESPEERIELRTVRPSEVQATLAPIFESACAERGITLRFEIDPALEQVQTDPRLLTLILTNLVENSLKFAYENTAVRVAFERAGEDRWRIRVIDEGVGIPLEAQARIFERFYQVDASRAGPVRRRGTGLGLAIVKHAVRALGGMVGVESVWRQGTTMTVEFPLQPRPEGAALR